MSQEELKARDSPDRPPSVTNDFNLAGENSVITSERNENNHSHDKTVFDQDLGTQNISNEVSNTHSGENYTENNDHRVNSEETQQVIQGNSVPTTNSGESVRKDEHHEQKHEESENNEAALKFDRKTEDTQEEISEREGDPDLNKEEGEINVEQETEVDNLIQKQVEGESLNGEKEHELDTQEKNYSDISDGVKHSSGKSETETDRSHSAEPKEADDGLADEDDYKDDFEEEDVNLKQDENTNRADSEENIHSNGIQVEPNKNEVTNKDSEEITFSNIKSNEQNEEQVIIDGDKDIPKVVLTASEEQPDSESENNNVDVHNSTSDKENDIDNNIADMDEDKNINADALTPDGDTQDPEDNKDSGFIESHEGLDNLNKQDQEKSTLGSDGDEFWDTDVTDNGKEKERKRADSESNNQTAETIGNNLDSQENLKREKDNQSGETLNTKLRDGEIENTSYKNLDKGEYLTTTEEGKEREGTKDKNSNGETTGHQEIIQGQEKKKEPIEQPPPQPEPKKPPSPEPVKQESPLEQLLKRNVEIDGSVESITELESNVTKLLQSMKVAMKHYTEQLSLQTLRDFSRDMGKFRGDFESINDAYRRCGRLATTMNNQLKELRHATEDCKTTIYRKFQNEDLATWIDISPEKTAEKQKLQEEVISAEKAAMAKAAEARSALATATVGVAEANQFVAETETYAAEAEAVAKKANALAWQALLAVEEAKLAAEEKRKAEEAAKKRAEERARKKEEEEKQKRAEEEVKIYQQAAKKGTSVDDERKLLQEEKARKEAERRDPKNWPKYMYSLKGEDFNPGVGCIIRAIDGTLRTGDLQCRRISQESGILTLSNNEELISNIIEVKPTDPDMKFYFEEPMSVALPVCVKRMPFGREAVIKIHQTSGRWSEVPTADVVFDDNREQKFVETRRTKFGIFVVVLRYKKDNLMLLKKGAKVTSSVDSRISFTCKPGTFRVDTNFNLEVQPVDPHAISSLRARAPTECEELYTTSPFIKLSLPTRRSLVKPLTITLPLPPNQSRLKRPQTAVAKLSHDTEVRPATARPSTTQERKEESTEDVHFLYLDEKTGWTKNRKTEITQITNKDMVSFDITEPYHRILVLRTKIGLKDSVVEKMASLLDTSLTQRNVKAFLRQRNADLYDVVISCVSSDRTERTLKTLADEGFEEGAPPSKDLILKEGQQMYIRFRGNVTCITENPKLSLIFNTHIKCRTDLKVMESDTFAQKGLPCYRGFAQLFTRTLVPNPLYDGAKKSNEHPEMIETEVLLAELLIEIPKPETEPPKPLKIVPVQLNDGPLTDNVLNYLSTELGKEWKDVAIHLNLKPMRIQAILRQNVNKDTTKTRYDMLVSWAKRIPKSVDKVQILVNALHAAGRSDLAEEVRYRGEDFKQKRIMSARVSHLRQAFVKVAKANSVFKKWKNFAKGLGVPDEEIKKIEETGGSGQEKCYSSLETWKEMSGEDATVTALATILKGAKEDRLSSLTELLKYVDTLVIIIQNVEKKRKEITGDVESLVAS